MGLGSVACIYQGVGICVLGGFGRNGGCAWMCVQHANTQGDRIRPQGQLQVTVSMSADIAVVEIR